MDSDRAKQFYYAEGKSGRKLWTAGFVAFIFLNVFIFLGFDVLLPTLTVFLEDHGHSRDAIGRIFSFFTVAAIIMRMLAPRLVLAFKPFVLVRVGLFIAGLAVIYYFFARTAPTASVARFFHGFGFGITSTVLTALAAQTVPGNKMAQGMGFLGLGTILTLAVGPSLGIWLKDTFGYLVMFLVVCGFYFCGLLMTLRMPDIELPAPPPDKPKPKLVFLSRLALAPSIMMFMVGISIAAVTIYMALYFKEIDFNYTGHFFGFATIGILVSRLAAGQIQDRFGHRTVILPAVIFMTVAMAMIPYLTGTTHLLVTAVFWGLSTGTLFPSVQALAFNDVSPHQRTSVASSLFNAFDIGIGFGSIVLGYVCQYFETYRVAFFGGLINCLAFLFFYFFYYFVLHPPTPRDIPKPAPEPAPTEPLTNGNLLKKADKKPL
ncbi:MAG: MFS transporter [Deltaproteobacteria bacterium]|jgi:predicted MFS family arabinose efflux permease|nr:MFS transporter [Deltaproteobacteria bacterium]